MQSVPEKTESLSKRLDSMISEIERSAKMAKMVSMNASVIAVRNRSLSSESLAFETVASQIMDISEASLDRIEGLRGILREMDSLSSIINKAGRQRMLSQRYMKLVLSSRLSDDPDDTIKRELQTLKDLFENSMRELINCPLNTDTISNQLLLTQGYWDCFTSSVQQRDFNSATEQNETVLVEMNKAVQLYESLVTRK